MERRLALWVVFLVLGAAGCGSGSSQSPDGGRDAGRDGDAGDLRAGTGGKGGAGGTGDASISSGGQTGSSGGSGVGGSASGGSAAGGAASSGMTGGGGASVGGAGGGAGAAVGGAGGSGGIGGTGNGGRGTGGAAGSGSGGRGTGGASTGGASTGGASTGGSSTGGAASGGMGTGGAGTGGAGTGGMGTGGAGTGGAAPTAASLFVVAHPDDDLVFINPALSTAIQAGRAVTTVYLTSGDGGDVNSIWRDREINVRAAHASMAGVASNWTCATASYGGKAPIRCLLSGKPVRSFFLRIRDGETSNLRSATGTAATIDDSTTYTAANLNSVLTAILNELQPGEVGMLDATLAHGFDHADHITSAMFALDVARNDRVARALTLYRGYSIYEPSFVPAPKPEPEPQNLSTAQYMSKLETLLVYQSPNLDERFDDWCRRHYPITAVTGPAGRLLSAAGQCLQASGTTDGSAVTVATCNGSAAQTWTVAATGRVTYSGKCLAVGSDETSVIIETCGSAVDQHWTLLSDGQLHGMGGTCLAVSGSAVTSVTCGVDMSQPRYTPPTSQRWSL